MALLLTSGEAMLDEPLKFVSDISGHHLRGNPINKELVMKAVALAALTASCLTIVDAAQNRAQADGAHAASRFNSASARVDNQWFPLRPGSRYVYTGTKDGKRARDVVTVTHRTRTIAGIATREVRDQLFLNGVLEERTSDWYAQDRTGNVWYFGEDTAELRTDGTVRSTEGTWRAGIKRARAGIYMPAQPRVGQSGRQEFLKGHAEDHFRVLSLHATVRTPATSSRRALLTKEWTPLEPGVVDHKLYVRGIGTAREKTVKGGTESLTLQSFTRG
jgi:hypothetical protein